MSWILKRLGLGVRTRLTRYDEVKKEFEEVLRNTITITIDLPEGLENLLEEFLALEKDEAFLNAVKELAKKLLEPKRSQRDGEKT